jgi:hypothetical protein
MAPILESPEIAGLVGMTAQEIDKRLLSSTVLDLDQERRLRMEDDAV